VRILYYTHPALFEPALCLVRELSRHAEVHLVLEVSPGAWQSAAFDLTERELPPGLVPGDDVLRSAFPAGVRAYWQSASSFHLAVHRTRRSVHPASWAVSRRVLRFAGQVDSDLLHVDDVDVSPRLALALPGAKRPPMIVTVHDPEPHSGEHNWRKGLARRLAYPRASRFVLYNSALREPFAQRFQIPTADIHTARLGAYDIYREWPASAAPGQTPTVLFFGRLSPYKGLDVFYRAAALIAARLRGIRFVVAGRRVPGYTPPLPPAVPGSEIEVRDRYLSNEETATLFRNASVAICPYRDATQSGVVLTAFAFGVPVVASDAGGLPEYVSHGQTGLVVPVGDAEATADAACRILENGGYRATLSANIAAAREGSLGWRQTTESVLRAYEGA
jgi:glycosyltransferase involved in cell wall biosynthesis